MMKNTAAFFALVAGALACAGLVLTLLSYVAVYFFLQGVDSMVSPQIDTLSAAVSDSQQTVSDAADAAGSASVAIANITHSLSAYAGASDSIGATLSSFSQNQLLSALAPQIADSVSKLNDASSSMREAATALNSTSASAGAAAASLHSAASTMETAKESMAQAKQGFKSALGMLSIAAMMMALCGISLFSSVGLLSLSLLISHYPDLLSKKPAEAAQQHVQ